MKKMFSIIFAAAIALSAYTCVSAQEDIRFVRDSGFTQHMRPPVSFAHDEHNEKAEINDCGFCHHVYDEKGEKLADETSEDQECSACHVKDPANPDAGELALKFHLRCKGCHEEVKAGPVMCAQCHKRSNIGAVR